MATLTESQISLVASVGAPTSSSKRQTLASPVVVVGNGPVGMRAVEEILKRDRSVPVIVYGEEDHKPYDRVKLSSWLIGDVNRESIESRYRRPFGSVLEERYGLRVTSIDRQNKVVIDAEGTRTQYEKLILATGSSAHIPDIEGICLDGVFKLRNIDDATQLFARQFRSRHTVVIGGGLLGLESARGMQKYNTKVTVIENSNRLMFNQLDDTGAEIIRESLEELGFEALVGSGVKRIVGDERVTGVQLTSDAIVDCDTVIIATGIRPNIELAKQAGLYFGRGITVDNQLRTSDPSIYAIGECAEHQGQIYGLVAPGFEHASTAANHIVGDPGEYFGSISAARLKVVGMNVFSVSPPPDQPKPLNEQFITYRDEGQGIYRKIQLDRDRVIGAIGIGEWDQSLRVQSAISDSVRLKPWHKYRFRRTGDLWSKQSANEITAWPATAVICQCNNISKADIEQTVAAGSKTIDAIGQSCGAGMVCGSCKPQLAALLGNPGTHLIGGYRKLLAFAVVALVMSLTLLFAQPVAYVSSVQKPELFGLAMSWHWDSLWRDSLLKQISGFTILGAVAIGLFLSPRKRLKGLNSFGGFDGWRVAHLVFSVIALCSLLVHTGFRLGYGLNFALMMCFVGLIVVGIATTLAMTIGARKAPALAVAVKQVSLRLHIYLFWPIPLLLGWHILKGYWY
ncbi:MAG: FAD-dependent oxidoreductase [Gammaproteobacteria bacterium]|nr:FAD-dependent oxidoreductase [Gammaproteobacteria bacterium]